VLSSQKVELTTVDDVVNRFKSIIDINNKSVGTLENSRVELKASSLIQKEVVSKCEVLLDQISQFEKQIKDLGLDMPSDIKSKVGMLNAILKESKKSASNITKALGLIS
jgi:type I site-specific restriction endonuclease